MDHFEEKQTEIHFLVTMKITIITSPFGNIPPYGYGGVEKIWYDVSEEFINHF